MSAHCLVVAKAPVAGVAKTRLARGLGPAAAADLAAASLLDTLAAVESAFDRHHRHLALTGDLAEAARGAELADRLAGWRVFGQEGESFGARLAHAHAHVGSGPVVQIGMDTPQVSGRLLAQAVDGLDCHDAVLGPATDGGWWVLALRDPAQAEVLRGVPTSRPDTGSHTLQALRGRGLAVLEGAELRDVDEVDDAAAVALDAPATRFASTWRDLTAGGHPVGRVFAAALRGHRCHVVGLDDDPSPLPVEQWLRPADDSDAAVARHCTGDTIDVGCGPGRMSALLQQCGHEVLGIDLVPEAVALAATRGVTARRQDVFDTVPGEGRWQTALLADGNIGIGGDPVALLRRLHEVVGGGGRVVADLDPPGTGVETRWARLRIAGAHSRPFRWSIVGADAVRPIAADAGFDVVLTEEHDGRWFTVLEKAP